MLIGHERQIDVMRKAAGWSSRAYLFVGPPSVGKWTAAGEVLQSWGVSGLDVLAISRLTLSDAREAVTFASYAPLASPLRVVIARITPNSEDAQNVLLKAVEEAPATTRFILISSGETPLTTLMSRSTVLRFDKLSVDDLAAILEQRGFKPTQARVWAERGEGQVNRALAYREINDAKPLVNSVVKAFREKDPALLEKAADGWTEAHTDLLVTWCNECISRCWNIFSEEEADVRGRTIPMKILVALHADVRPKLVVKALLADVLRSMQ